METTSCRNGSKIKYFLNGKQYLTILESSYPFLGKAGIIGDDMWIALNVDHLRTCSTFHVKNKLNTGENERRAFINQDEVCSEKIFKVFLEYRKIFHPFFISFKISSYSQSMYKILFKAFH